MTNINDRYQLIDYYYYYDTKDWHFVPPKLAKTKFKIFKVVYDTHTRKILNNLDYNSYNCYIKIDGLVRWKTNPPFKVGEDVMFDMDNKTFQIGKIHKIIEEINEEDKILVSYHNGFPNFEIIGSLPPCLFDGQCYQIRTQTINFRYFIINAKGEIIQPSKFAKIYV